MKVFTYIIGCKQTKQAVVIDPAGKEEKILEEAKSLDLEIKYIFNTHYHADHTCGNRKLKKLTNAKILIHKLDAAALLKVFDIIKIFTFNFNISPKPDILIDKEKNFKVGCINFDLIHTPGHSKGGLCFYANGNLFSGDTLFVGDSGRTDLPGGNRDIMGKSLKNLMNILPGNTILWPGHDYGETKNSTLDIEKKTNKNAVEYGFYSGY